MTIEATLQSINSHLAKLVELVSTGAKATPAAQELPAASDPFIAGAGAEPAVAKQVDQAIANAGGASGEAAPAPTKRGRGRPAKSTTTETPAAAPVAQPQVDPFAIGAEETIAAPARTLDDVRAALIVYQYKNGQPAALKLVKDVTGAETLAQIKPEDYSKLFQAAIPADKFEHSDVRLVLVKTEERKQGGGIEVLKRFGVSNLPTLTEDKFVQAIIAAHQVK